jgi:hypothetical protein
VRVILKISFSIKCVFDGGLGCMTNACFVTSCLRARVQCLCAELRIDFPEAEIWPQP